MAITKIQTRALVAAVTDDITANSAKTGITSGQASAITANTAKVTNSTSASDLTSGTLPDAAFPSTLPAASGANLTALPAANITGTLPAISGANLTGVRDTTGGRKNLIINGGFDVWQRGTSFTTSAEYTADRWQLQLSGGTSTVTQQTFTVGQTEVPDNPTYYLKMNTTTADNNCGMFYRVEDVRNGAGQNVTISFWAKGTNPAGGTFDLMSSQRFGAGGSSNVEITTPLTVTSSWAKYTHTFSLASISGKTMGTGSSLVLIIRQSAGDTSTTAWNLNLANVQLELGSVATDFEHRSYGEELALCQRYYEVCYAWQQGMATGASQYVAAASVLYAVPKRALPTLSVTDGGFGSSVKITVSGERNSSTSGFGLQGISTASGEIYSDTKVTADAEL